MYSLAFWRVNCKRAVVSLGDSVCQVQAEAEAGRLCTRHEWMEESGNALRRNARPLIAHCKQYP